MARVGIFGLNTGSIYLDSGANHTSLPSGFSYDATIFRSGAKSLKVVASSGTQSAVNHSAQAEYFRVYVRVTARPASSGRILCGSASGPNILLNADGTLSARTATVVIGTSTTALTDTSRWYRIEFRASQTSIGTYDILKIDGIAEVTGGTVFGGFIAHLGPNDTVAQTYTAYFSDLVADNATFPGDTSVVMSLPVSDVSRGGWTGGAGGTTSLFDALNNVPPVGLADASATNTSQIESATNSATDNASFNLQSYTTVGIPSENTIRAVQAVTVHGEAIATGTKAGAIAITANPIQGGEDTFNFGNDAGAIGTFPTTWSIKQGTIIENPASIIYGTSPVVQIGKRTATTRLTDACFLGLWIEYATSTRIYLPASSAAPAVSPTPDAAWGQTTGFDRVKASLTKTSTAMTSKTLNLPNNSTTKCLNRQYVLGPLKAGAVFTINSSRISGQQRGSSTDSAAPIVGIRLFASDGSTVRATILAAASYSTAYTTTLTNRKDPPARFVEATITTNDNDYLVIEIGGVHNFATNSKTLSQSFGDDSATDLATDDATTAADNPWIDVGAVLEILAGSGTTATPLPATSTWVVPTVSVAVGGVSATPLPATGAWTSVNPTSAQALAVSPLPSTSAWVSVNPTYSLAYTPLPATSAWVVPAVGVALGGISATPLPATGAWTSVNPTSAQALAVSPLPTAQPWVSVNPTTAQGGISATPLPGVGPWVSVNPTTAQGGISATPLPATSSWIVPAPSVALAIAPSPAPAVSSWVVPAVAVAVGGVGATPLPATHPWVSVNPTTAQGGISAAPLPATGTWVSVNPTYTLGFTPAPAVSTWVVPAVSFSGSSPINAQPGPSVSNWVDVAPSVALGGISATPLPPASTWVAVTPSVAVGGVTASPLPANRPWVSVNPTSAQGDVASTPQTNGRPWVVPAPAAAVGGISATPLPSTGTWASVSPGAAKGNVTASPLPAVSSWVVPAVSMQSGGSVSPQPATRSWVVNAPSVSLGNVGVTALPAVRTWSSVSPSVALDSSVSPSPTARSWVTNAPSVTLGSVTVTPLPPVRTWQPVSPSVALDLSVSPLPAVSMWGLPAPVFAPGNVDASTTPAVIGWVTEDPSYVTGDTEVAPPPSVLGWVVPLAVWTEYSNAAEVKPPSLRRFWFVPSAMFRAPLTFTSLDIMQQVAEAIVGILDTDQDVVAITGRSSINCVPFEDSTFNELPIYDYFIADGIQVGGLGDTREVIVDIRATAESGSVCNEMLRLAEQKLIAPRFAALGLDGCQLRAKRRDVDVDPDAEQDVKTKLLELTLLVTI